MSKVIRAKELDGELTSSVAPAFVNYAVLRSLFDPGGLVQEGHALRFSSHVDKTKAFVEEDLFECGGPYSISLAAEVWTIAEAYRNCTT